MGDRKGGLQWDIFFTRKYQVVEGKEQYLHTMFLLKTYAFLAIRVMITAYFKAPELFAGDAKVFRIALVFFLFHDVL